MNKSTKLLTSLPVLGLSLALAVSVAFAATNTEVITANDLEDSKIDAYANGSWFIYDDVTELIDNPQATFVTGPDTAPEGLGSVQLSVIGTQRENLATYRFKGTELADITTLAYSTYNPSAGNGGSANRSGYLQFNVDFNGTDTWQRRLIFLPSDNGTVQQDTWQEWDALNGGDALWRYSGPTWPGTVIAGTTPRTWSDILASYPGVRIRVTDSFLGIRVGEPYPDGYTENIDAFRFGTGSDVTTFDFEPLVSPTSKDQCKKDGWKMFNNPTFKNQGNCVSYTNKL